MDEIKQVARDIDWDKPIGCKIGFAEVYCKCDIEKTVGVDVTLYDGGQYISYRVDMITGEPLVDVLPKKELTISNRELVNSEKGLDVLMSVFSELEIDGLGKSEGYKMINSLLNAGVINNG